MIRIITTATLITLSLPTTVMAEARPRAGVHDSRITYVNFQDGQVYTLYTRLRNITLVELGDGETIRSIASGDSEAFKIEKLEGPNVLTVKPVFDEVSTNLTVETNRRIYFFNVIESAKVTPNWSLKVTVPRSGGSRTTMANYVPPEIPMTYKILSRTKGAEFAPIGISDNGKKTLFQIPPGAPVPSIFRADAQGQEYSVNSSVNGTIITVGSRSERWVLRYGDDSVCVEGMKAEGL